MNTKEKYYTLIYKELFNELSLQEKGELSAWLESSRENRDNYKVIKNKFGSVPIPVPKNKFDTEYEWKRLEKRISLTRFNIGAKYYGIAASIVILTGLFFYYSFLSNPLETIKNGEYFKKRVKLPDNSVVILNKNSEMRYRINEQKREVHLYGEAYFEIRKSNIRFIVKTPNSSVQVLGTKFNVEARENYSSVAVTSGKVSFVNENNENVILTANQFSKCDSKGILSTLYSVNVDSLIVWTKTRIVFEKSSLKEILERLEKEFSVKYIVADKELLAKELSAVFEHENLNIIHKSIETALNISINKKGDSYYIKK